MLVLINLLYCGNEGVFDGVMLSLLSAAEKTSCELHAYVMTMNLTELDSRFTPLTEGQISYIDSLLKKQDSRHSVERIDSTTVFLKEMSGCPNLLTGYTPYSLLRLLADKFDLPDELLYVDCDTMFNGDISEIKSYDISNYELAGAVDHLGKRFIAKDYINSGVLYMNMKIIRETQLFARCRVLCMEKEMPFPDQDAINELVTKKLLLPAKFNQQDKLKEDTVIQHFSKTIRFFPYFKIINVKPWELELVHEVLKLDAYDEIFQNYITCRDAVSGVLAPPRRSYNAPPAGKQFRNDLHEVFSYAGQNGGIFRKKGRERVSNGN